MSLATGFLWTYKTHRLLGYSVAGLSTSLVFPEADVCFDVAQGLPFQMGTSNLLISHAHMDHAAGIPYVVAMKSRPSSVTLRPSGSRSEKRTPGWRSPDEGM